MLILYIFTSNSQSAIDVGSVLMQVLIFILANKFCKKIIIYEQITNRITVNKVNNILKSYNILACLLNSNISNESQLFLINSNRFTSVSQEYLIRWSTQKIEFQSWKKKQSEKPPSPSIQSFSETLLLQTENFINKFEYSASEQERNSRLLQATITHLKKEISNENLNEHVCDFMEN